MMVTRLLVQHIPYDTTPEDMRALFETQGDVVSVDVPRDHITGQLKGYAVVEMASAAEAEDAVAHLNHYEVAGHRLRVKFAEGSELADAALEVEIEAPAPHEHQPELPAHRPERKAVRSPRSSVW
jgi:RNA recognition motif-containing protein